MNHKLISTQSVRILTHFYQRNQDCFDTSEARAALPNSGQSAVKELLSDMVRRGLLLRIKKGLYHLIPYEQDARTFMPDWHLLVAPLTQGTEHYIGYYSALHLHNLITQPSLKEQIVVAKQIKPSTLLIQDVPFQFIYHNPHHFFGAEKVWANAFHKVSCSDLEKTLIDCLFKPHYAGGIVEIAKALHTAKNTLDYERLLQYTRRFNSQAVIKRLGFLLEALGIRTGITNPLLQSKTASYVVLDTELPKSGPLIPRWSIRQNLDLETIQSALYT